MQSCTDRFQINNFNREGVIDCDGPKTSALNGAPLLAPFIYPSSGYAVVDHFNLLSDEWVVTNYTAGTAACEDARNGVVLLDAASTTDDQGVQIQKLTESFAPESGKGLWFACRFKVNDVSEPQLFLGLSTEDTTGVFQSGAFDAANDYIGFFMDVNSAGALEFVVQKASSTAEELSTTLTLADDTWYEVGFYADWSDSSDPRVRVYYRTASGTLWTYLGEIDVTNMPVGLMSESFACLSEGGNAQPELRVDWFVASQDF